MAHYLKFAILQGIVIAVLAAAFISGSLKLVMESEAKWIILGLSSALIYGLTNVARKAWWRSAFASQILVRCGIVGLQTSMILALLLLAADGGNSGYLMILVQGMLASVFAIGSSIYIDLTAHLLGDSHAQE